MVGNDADTNNSPSQNNNTNSFAEYLKRASAAKAAGDVVLSLHLYMAAYERALQDSSIPDIAVIQGLRQAWDLACENKEHSLAEYIFEKLEPYLSAEEIAQFASKLQRLALDKLEEFGLSREDLEDMTDLISQDFFGVDPDSVFMRAEQTFSPSNMFGALQRGLIRDRSKEPEKGYENSSTEQAVVPKEENSSKEENASGQENIASKEEASLPEVLLPEMILPESNPYDNEGATRPDNMSKPPSMPKLNLSGQANIGNKAGGNMLSGMLPFEGIPGLFTLPGVSTQSQETNAQPVERMTYNDLVGYEAAIETMRSLGIGMENDPSFKELVETLNARHGLHRAPVTDTLLFRSPVREDANQFMLATMGELGFPAIRMRMEENLQGMPVLCVMASSDNQPRLNVSRNSIEGRGVLILEDIDMWGAPISESSDDVGGFVYTQLSRGAREAINLIRSAVENPDVFVLVSSGNEVEIDPFFQDFLGPMTVVDIEIPTLSEREDLWENIAKEHPSLKAVDRASLVRYSSNMSRFDIYMAAREAVEDAYKQSLTTKKYIPVTAENVFEKIAAYQPLESDEYSQLENEVVDTFRKDIDNIDDLLKGSSE